MNNYLTLKPEKIHILKIIARILLASLFVISAMKSILFDFNGFAGAVRSKNIPFPFLVATLVLTTKLLGGLSIIFDKYSKIGTVALVAFTLLATVLFHNAFKDPTQFNSMMKNISIIGGLLFYLAYKL